MKQLVRDYPKIDLAVDCGVVVNPDRVRAQMEGAAVMGISNTLYSNITMKKGRTEQSNFTDYLVARTDITPDTFVHIVESSASPGGVGEPGVPPVAPAICNAIHAATGKRIRALPVDPDQLRVPPVWVALPNVNPAGVVGAVVSVVVLPLPVYSTAP